MNLLPSLLLLVAALSAAATEFTIRITDEDGSPVADAGLRIVLGRRNDPRYSSDKLIESKSGVDGKVVFTANADMCLSRIDIKKDGHYPCLVDEWHGICHFDEKQSYTFALPRRVQPTSLRARKVYLRFTGGNYPENTWISYDFEKGDMLPPFGKGEVTDIRFRTTSVQEGWRMEPEALAFNRQHPDYRNLTTEQFARHFGHWNSKVEIAFPEPGSGIIPEPKFWPYCQLSMPPVAPESNYQPNLTNNFTSRHLLADERKEPGFFLRTRVKMNTDGSIASAHYAKIVGPISYSYTKLRFTYYFNAKPNDRGLELALNKNQLKWDKSRPLEEQSDLSINEP